MMAVLCAGMAGLGGCDMRSFASCRAFVGRVLRVPGFCGGVETCDVYLMRTRALLCTLTVFSSF